jgi:HK97 family phage prohead protease
MNNREIRKSLFSKNIEFRTSEESGGKRIIEAVIPYNSKSQDLGGFREVITPTAFKRSLEEGKNIFALYNHDDSKVLGSTKSGTLELRNEDDGLYCKLRLGNTSFANDTWDVVSRGDCNTLSFAFRPVKVTNRSNLRYLESVELFEVSFCVATPAYENTTSIAYTRNKKENKTMKNNSIISRSVNIEKLEELFSDGNLISDLETVKEILSFIDPETLKNLTSQADERAEGQGGKEDEKEKEGENKEGGGEDEAEKEKLLEEIEAEIQKEPEQGLPESESEKEKEGEKE